MGAPALGSFLLTAFGFGSIGVVSAVISAVTVAGMLLVPLSVTGEPLVGAGPASSSSSTVAAAAASGRPAIDATSERDARTSFSGVQPASRGEVAATAAAVAAFATVEDAARSTSPALNTRSKSKAL